MDISSDFLVTCLLMGVGIAIDVAIATVSRFHRSDMTFRSWSGPITFFHVLFPALGYFIFWRVSESYHWLEPFLGITGFILVFLLINEVICESMDKVPFFAPADFLARVSGIEEHESRNLLAVLAVSWDSLLSGPALAVKAALENWSLSEVTLSIFVSGLVVLAVSLLSLYVAHRLLSKNFSDSIVLARFSFKGKYVELSVIGGFGIFSLWNGVFGEGNLWWSVVAASVLMAGIFFIFRRELMENEILAAREAIYGED